MLHYYDQYIYMNMYIFTITPHEQDAKQINF